MYLRRRIELYLRRTRMSATRFGRETINDLRNGRELREQTIARIERWLDRQEQRR
jgi:hypothetical protein